MTEDQIRTAAQTLGELVVHKNVAYGNTAACTSAMLRALYPHGVPVAAYQHMLLVVRILDKLARIAVASGGADLDDEDPFRDIAGYGLLGLLMSKTSSVQ